MLSAFVARMFDPKHNLAAWGIVVSLAMILASPVMMMLSASTALSKDWASYCRVRRYMFVIAGGLTQAYSPDGLYAALRLGCHRCDGRTTGDRRIDPDGADDHVALVYPALAFRRLNYGVLIRFGHQSAITVGAIIRPSVEAVVVGILFSMGTLPGVALAAVSMSCGVIAEGSMLAGGSHRFCNLRCGSAPPVEQPLTAGTFSLSHCHDFAAANYCPTLGPRRQPYAQPD